MNEYMETDIIIIEKEEPVPEEVRIWAKRHLVAVVPERNCGEDALLDAYTYVIEYSKDVSLRYLEIAYCHTHNLPAVIAETEDLTIKEIGMDETEDYRRIIENFPDADATGSLPAANRRRERQTTRSCGACARCLTDGFLLTFPGADCALRQ